MIQSYFMRSSNCILFVISLLLSQTPCGKKCLRKLCEFKLVKHTSTYTDNGVLTHPSLWQRKEFIYGE